MTASTSVIRIDLDAVRVYRNNTEFRTTQRARSSLGHEITGDGHIVAQMAELLRRENPDFTGTLEVYRGDTLCFFPMPLKRAFTKGKQPEHLRRYQQQQRAKAAA